MRVEIEIPDLCVEHTVKGASMLIRLAPIASMSSMSHMKNIEIYQVVAGKRFQGGKVLETFTSADAHKCGGPATAALRASQRMSDKGIECHARKYHADLHGSLES